MRYIALLLFYLFTFLPLNAKVIKVLAIGNSFSEDAVEQNLYELARAQGDSLVIGNAYIGGCSIESHYMFLRGDSARYAYRKVVGGIRAEHRHATLQRIIRDEPWDLITFQQASPLSGMADTFVFLPSLMRQVRIYCSSLHTQFAWHMTWAYAEDCPQRSFANYDRNQLTMYSAIVSAMLTVLPSVGIQHIIPSGVAIQLARRYFGDVLNRDGYHLSYTLGRYTAACTWCEFLTGRSVAGNLWHPDTLTDDEAQHCQQAAHEAVVMQQHDNYAVF